jgi:hypothetical protein
MSDCANYEPNYYLKNELKGVKNTKDNKKFLQTLPKIDYYTDESSGSGKIIWKGYKSCYDNQKVYHTTPQKLLDSITNDDILKATINKINCNEKCKKDSDGKSSESCQKCCKCATSKKGGYINLTKSQAKELIKQIGGNSIKSIYITYNGNNAKILGYNKQTQQIIIQSGSGLENISINNLLVNGKSVI